MQTPQKQPLYRQIYEVLEQQVLNNELRVGDVMPSEQALAGQLNVHRSSVREALRLLEENGLAARKPGGKKLFITTPNRRKLGARLSNTLVLEEVTFNELYEGTLLLDEQMAPLAAERISPAQLNRLAKNLASTEKHIRDNQALLELDFEFHDIVAEATCNKVLQVSRLGAGDLFYTAVNLLVERLDVGERLLVAHRHIYKGLRDHDPDYTRSWTVKHIEDFKRGYEVVDMDIHASLQSFLSTNGTDTP